MKKIINEINAKKLRKYCEKYSIENAKIILLTSVKNKWMKLMTTQEICIFDSMCLLHEFAPRMHILYFWNLAINISIHNVNIERSLNVIATIVFWIEI